MQNFFPVSSEKELLPLQYVAYEVADCAVCMEKMTENLSVMSCGHVYHQKCVEPLIHPRTGGSCPVCRASVQLKHCIKMIFNLPSKVIDFKRHLEILSGLGKDSLTHHAHILVKVTETQEKLENTRRKLEESEKEKAEIKEELGIQQHKATVLKDKFIQLTTVHEQMQKELNKTIKQLADAQATSCQALEELVMKQEKLQNYELIIKSNAEYATINFSEELAAIDKLAQDRDCKGLTKRARDLLCQCVKQEGRMETLEKSHQKAIKDLEDKNQRLKDNFRKMLEISKEKTTLVEEARRSSTFTAQKSGELSLGGAAARQSAPGTNTNANVSANASATTGGGRVTQVQMPRPPSGFFATAGRSENAAREGFKAAFPSSIFDRKVLPDKGAQPPQ